MAETIQVDTTQLDALVADLREGAIELRNSIRRVVTRRMQAAEREAVQKASGRLVDLAMGREIHRRTGRLAASISHRVEEEAGAILGRLGILSGGEVAKYAGVQEFGATITPKNAKVLAIPLKAAKTAAGVPRFTPREAGEFYDSTWWGTSRKGNLILFGRRGGKLVPLFVGVTSVTVKPAYFLTSTMNNAAALIQQELETSVVGELLSGQRGA